MEYYDDNLCNGCEYEEEKGDWMPCNSCISLVDGYLEAKNYSNKHLANNKLVVSILEIIDNEKGELREWMR